MDKNCLKNSRFSRISRNEALENDKFDIIQKFGFSTFMSSTSIHSKKKSFIEGKSVKTETPKKYIFKNKISIKKNKSAIKPKILKNKIIIKNPQMIKIDFPLNITNNNFSHTQEIDSNEDKNKRKNKNKINITPNDFPNTNSLKNNSNNKTNHINKNKIKIKNIIFNQSALLKYKENKNYNENTNNKNEDSNKITIIEDEINMCQKRDLYNKKEIAIDNNSNNKEGKLESYYNLNDSFSSEKNTSKYNMHEYNAIEHFKNINNSFEENLCELNDDISERRNNDNILDKNSILLSNTNNNTLTYLIKKKKEKHILDNVKKESLFTKLPILLKNTDSCIISSINDLNDFFKIKNKKIQYEKEYKFINDIEKDTDKFPLLNINSFLNLNDSIIYRLMGFIFDYSSILIRSNSLVKSKIKNAFYNIFSDTIKNFSFWHSSFLKIINYYFENRKMIINKKIMHTFNLVIICKVITKEINKSYDISYNYISNNKEYDNLWKIDIKRKNDIKIWLHTELFTFNNCIYNFTSTSQISSFSYGDEVKFEINIFNHKRQINPYSIEWIPPVINNIENNIFETNKFITKTIFDPLRCNEMEMQALIWEEISINNNNNDLVKEFINIFKKNFKIKNIYTYTSRHVFYKFRIIPNKKGIFAKNKFLFFDLNIIDYDKPLQNEVQSIYLMNSNFYNKRMDVRIGTIIIFYITDYKS